MLTKIEYQYRLGITFVAFMAFAILGFAFIIFNGCTYAKIATQETGILGTRTGETFVCVANNQIATLEGIAIICLATIPFFAFPSWKSISGEKNREIS